MSWFSNTLTVGLLGSMVAIPVFLSYNGGIKPPAERDAKIIQKYQDCPEKERGINGKCKNYRNNSTHSRLGSRSFRSGK